MQDKNKPNGVGIKRIFKASYCSYLGLKAAFREESAFRQELLLAVIMFPNSFLLAESVIHWAMLISVLLLVLIVELLNSAIEALTDRVSTEHHILSGRAKDMGSAAVTLSLLAVAIIWGAALYSKYIM
ncbi:diacylglycerol kinase [Pseudoalteromonas sp. NBT06-2]|uniref:diacylglycerol kinase n=1 Tax=Pseudoalteromonas sp. NBT06-2 TaxID=2025950 RepID=UPI000BA58EF8|nr:diacylglycerol kinase [Pseudoalteromonas sp. NBT06-2]PAJ71845.1 diacylglycerol kinase [Pseudoalteromonas sp. NBT06-2]